LTPGGNRFNDFLRINQTLGLPFWTAHAASWTAQNCWTVQLEYALNFSRPINSSVSWNDQTTVCEHQTMSDHLPAWWSIFPQCPLFTHGEDSERTRKFRPELVQTVI